MQVKSALFIAMTSAVLAAASTAAVIGAMQKNTASAGADRRALIEAAADAAGSSPGPIRAALSGPSLDAAPVPDTALSQQIQQSLSPNWAEDPVDDWAAEERARQAVMDHELEIMALQHQAERLQMEAEFARDRQEELEMQALEDQARLERLEAEAALRAY